MVVVAGEVMVAVVFTFRVKKRGVTATEFVFTGRDEGGTDVVGAAGEGGGECLVFKKEVSDSLSGDLGGSF